MCSVQRKNAAGARKQEAVTAVGGHGSLPVEPVVLRGPEHLERCGVSAVLVRSVTRAPLD